MIDSKNLGSTEAIDLSRNLVTLRRDGDDGYAAEIGTGEGRLVGVGTTVPRAMIDLAITVGERTYEPDHGISIEHLNLFGGCPSPSVAMYRDSDDIRWRARVVSHSSVWEWEQGMTPWMAIARLALKLIDRDVIISIPKGADHGPIDEGGRGGRDVPRDPGDEAGSGVLVAEQHDGGL